MKSKHWEGKTQPWLAANPGPVSLHEKVASEAWSLLEPHSCLQHELGPPRPKWTGMWRNRQTRENARALPFQAHDSVPRFSMD
ncbi:Hypothetical predicted protein, partial [Marmota monax]